MSMGQKLSLIHIFVTHDQDEAIEVADEIIITNAGRIEQKGTPIGVYRNPETAFTASFFNTDGCPKKDAVKAVSGFL